MYHKLTKCQHVIVVNKNIYLVKIGNEYAPLAKYDDYYIHIGNGLRYHMSEIRHIKQTYQLYHAYKLATKWWKHESTSIVL